MRRGAAGTYPPTWEPFSGLEVAAPFACLACLRCGRFGVVIDAWICPVSRPLALETRRGTLLGYGALFD